MSLLYGMSLYARWLFALLVWQREKPRTRIWLAETLWPDYPPEDEEKRSANFRQQLRTLRHALGKEVSRLSEWDNLAAPALSLDLTGAYVDVFAFERAYRRATSAAGTLSGLEGVVRLYRGEFLEGYQAPWVEEPRRRFQEYYLDALERLAAGTLAAGDAAQAEQWLRQAVETDRFRESAVRQLLGLLQESGRTTEAGSVYRSLLDAFRRERPDQLPEISTRDLFRRLNRESKEEPISVPPMASVSVPPPYRLPEPVSILIGRDRECDAIISRFGTARLVTLIGMGGIGKTRLAWEVARRLAPRYSGGAVFVDLSALPPTDDLRPIFQAMSVALHLPGSPVDTTGEGALLDSLNGRDLLLWLDNCEQFSSQFAAFVKRILQRVPGLRVLATSREALRVAGERPYRVPPLTLPPAPSACTAEVVLNSAAGRLFAERVALPDFVLSDADAASVGWICRALDGIPLAIELAAAALDRTGTIEALIAAMHTSLWFLREGDRTGPDRYQTLRATVEWSYQRLTPAEQAFLSRASVLVGGGTAAAYSAVCAVPDPLPVLDRLLAASLLLKDERQRYRLSEPIRQYAGEVLQGTRDAEDAPRRHAGYFTTLAEETAAMAIGSRQAEVHDGLEVERANLQKALEWAKTEDGTPGDAIGLRLIASLWQFWVARGGLRSAEEIVRGLLAKSDTALAPPALCLTALNGAGNMAFLLGDYQAAERRFNDCYRLSRSLNDRRAEAKALGGMANIAQSRREYLAAQQGFEACLTIFQELQDEQRAAITLSNLANLATHQRHFEAAIRWHEECLTLLRRLGETHDLTLALNNFAHTLFLANQDADVLRVLAEVFRVSGTMGSRRALVQGMSIAAALAARISDAGRAALLLGFQDAQREEAQIPLPESARESDLQLRSDLIETLGTRGYSEALTAGRGLETEEAIALAAHYSLPEVRTEG